MYKRRLATMEWVLGVWIPGRFLTKGKSARFLDNFEILYCIYV